MIFSITYHETYINNFFQTYHQVSKRLSDLLFIAVAAGLLVIIEKEGRCEIIKNFGPMWGQYALDTTP